MIPHVDLNEIAGELRRQARELARTFEDDPRGDELDPQPTCSALGECLEACQRAGQRDRDRPGAPPEAGCAASLDAIADHALGLMSRLTALAKGLNRPQEAWGIEAQALPFACWVARNGGEISHLEPVVNAAAALANRLQEPSQLEQLYSLLSEVVAAVSPQVSQDTGFHDPSRPWRVLVLNRAIVATRSHQPALMQDAFDHLVEQLPDDAPGFFREGMEQMEALSYPSPVRLVMQRYYIQWCAQRTLLH